MKGNDMEKKKVFGGAICGGGRKAAEKELKEKGHCKEHSKFQEDCDKCFNVWLDILDTNFMALM